MQIHALHRIGRTRSIEGRLLVPIEIDHGIVAGEFEFVEIRAEIVLPREAVDGSVCDPQIRFWDELL